MKGLFTENKLNWAFVALGAIALAVLVAHELHPLVAGASLAMLGLGRPVLTQADLDAHRTALATQDIIYAPIYDSANYASAGQNQIIFFTSPLGQGTTTAPSASGSKTLADTNLNGAGQLTKGNEFFMIGQELMPFAGQSPETNLGAGATVNGFINDIYTMGKAGFLTLQIGSNRPYIQDGPLMIFPPAARLAVASSYGGSSTAGTQSVLGVQYAQWTGEPYAITPVYIEATQGFQEILQWPALVTLNATARLYSRLRGYLIRNAQ